MNNFSAFLKHDLDLRDIAAEAAYSPFTFHRIFTEVIGEAVAVFIRIVGLQSTSCTLSGIRP